MRLRRSLLIALLVFASVAYLWGVRRDLPNMPGNDEVDFLLIAAQMVQTGDPNPHWFGHPGSTFIYPYAAALHSWNAANQGGPWFGAHPGLAERLVADRGAGLLVGRLVSVAFAVLALWMIVLVGDRAFGSPVGLIGGWFALLSPVTLDHVDMVRTDSAGLFFGFLATLAILRLLQAPSRGAHVAAGLALGFAIGTRYFLAGLLPLLAVVDLILLRARTGAERSREISSVLLAGASVIGGFLLSAPFLLPEISEVVENLAHEARGSHPGADGLDYLGNLTWYFRVALPRSVPAAFLIASVVGIAVSISRRETEPLLLLGFLAIFLGGVSLATLHWGRWLIQILPLICLFAAAGLTWAIRSIAQAAGLDRRAGLALALGVVAMSAQPAWAFAKHIRLQTVPSTRHLAREWIVTNLDESQRIAADLYTAPLQGTPFEDTDYVFSLAQVVASPEELRGRGYDVAMVSNAVYGRFFATPGRYPKETGFYRTLFRGHRLLAEFRPGPEGRGPVVRLYRLASD